MSKKQLMKEKEVIKVYPEITDEQKKAIRKIFAHSKYDDPSISFQTGKDGYEITTNKMYDYIEFAPEYTVLTAYIKIASILNCENGDEKNRNSSDGCETCGYGSSYEYTLKFW